MKASPKNDLNKKSLMGAFNLPRKAPIFEVQSILDTIRWSEVNLCRAY